MPSSRLFLPSFLPSFRVRSTRLDSVRSRSLQVPTSKASGRSPRPTAWADTGGPMGRRHSAETRSRRTHGEDRTPHPDRGRLLAITCFSKRSSCSTSTSKVRNWSDCYTALCSMISCCPSILRVFGRFSPVNRPASNLCWHEIEFLLLKSRGHLASPSQKTGKHNSCSSLTWRGGDSLGCCMICVYF